LGREVATLLNEDKSPGNYSVKFDASNLSSGLYIYKLQSGDFMDSKKMILVKIYNNSQIYIIICNSNMRIIIIHINNIF